MLPKDYNVFVAVSFDDKKHTKAERLKQFALLKILACTCFHLDRGKHFRLPSFSVDHSFHVWRLMCMEIAMTSRNFR